MQQYKIVKTGQQNQRYCKNRSGTGFLGHSVHEAPIICGATTCLLLRTSEDCGQSWLKNSWLERRGSKRYLCASMTSSIVDRLIVCIYAPFTISKDLDHHYSFIPILGQLKGSVKELNILIYFFFPPITQLCSISDVLFTGGRGVSDIILVF